MNAKLQPQHISTNLVSYRRLPILENNLQICVGLAKFDVERSGKKSHSLFFYHPQWETA